MVLSPTDAPQLGTLPDITPVLRAMLLQAHLEKCGFILTPLYSALPCIRRPTIRKPPPPPEQDTHQVCICILTALLLGLFPTSVKFPPFQIRVALYRRIHSLLTNGQGIPFCLAHPSLLTLALMEYCAYVIPANLPVEHEILAGEYGMQTFFSTCPLVCDTFRQELLVTGEEPWSELEAYCTPIVERHCRACKSRQRTRQPDQFPVVKLPPASTDSLVNIPFIVPYLIHTEDPTNCIMASEMAFLDSQNLETASPNPNIKQAVAMQRAVHTHQLPPNLTRLQLHALSARMRVCERSALSGSVLYVCISCVMANQQTICRKGRAFPTRGQCKFDLNTDSLLCSVCQSHSIISISTLGRIISLRNYRFYLAPCCSTVQIYTGRGDEFQSQDQPISCPISCPHKHPKTSSKSSKKRCELCSNVALPDPHASVDHLTGEQHNTYLCQRHSPNSDALKHVTNWRQLQEEIRRRDKPLFGIRYSGRRGS